MRIQNNIGVITAKLNIDKDLPEQFQLFAAGWGQLRTGERYLVDETAYDLIDEQFVTNGTDLVVDYEHQTLSGKEAPAAGWITALEWDPKKGILARVDWTDRAKQMLVAGEYRYHSPVFYVRTSDQRVVGLHCTTLTNTPKTINMAPLVAKLSLDDAPDHNNNEEESPMLKKLIAKLKLADDATEDQVMKEVDVLVIGAGKTTEVVAKDIINALGLKDGSDVAAVVAKIGNLKLADTAADDLAAQVKDLRGEISDMKADKLVAKALADGQTDPDELKKWGRDLAKSDPEKFETIVMHRAKGSVIPIKNLDGKKEKSSPSGHLHAAALAVAKLFGNTEEDLKQYGGIETP